MYGPIFDFTFSEVLEFFEGLLRKIKEAFASIGILVLPDEGELPADGEVAVF